MVLTNEVYAKEGTHRISSRARRGIIPILLGLHLERIKHKSELEGALLGALLRVAGTEVAAVQVGAHEHLALRTRDAATAHRVGKLERLPRGEEASERVRK